MSIESSVSLRFEDTKKHQDKLRERLNILESKSTFIKEDERNDYFEELANALLGLDGNREVKIKLQDNNVLKINNFGEFIRYLAYYQNEKLNIDIYKRFKVYKFSPNITIGELWREVKYIIFGIYPEALAMSIRMSKEREQREKAEGASIDDIE